MELLQFIPSFFSGSCRAEHLFHLKLLQCKDNSGNALSGKSRYITYPPASRHHAVSAVLTANILIIF